AGAGLDGADLRFAGQLGLQRGLLRTLVDQFELGGLDLAAQFADPGVDVGVDAGARVGVGAAVLLQLGLRVGQLAVVLVHLFVDPLVGLPGLALLVGQAFIVHRVGQVAGALERALGRRIGVGDLDQVGARIGDVGAGDDLLDQLVLLDRRRVVLPPAADLE